MYPHHLVLLRSPKNGQPLILSVSAQDGERIQSGTLSDGENTWPIIGFIPRFVPASDYWDSFSLQWERHPNILQASHSDLEAYKDRFEKETRWGDNLQGELILEAGCGAGSFTPLALKTGATVVSFDVSAGVETAYKYYGENKNLLLVQASIYEMPFQPRFDKVFCLGVLQHTPDPKKSFFQLIEMLRNGGKIVTDIYADIKFSRHHGMSKTKYFIRRFVGKIKPEQLYNFIKLYVKIIWPLCRLIQKIPRVGIILSQHLLFDHYEKRMTGMRPELYQEFAIVDIIDMLGAAYDLPATKDEFTSWHQQAGLRDIDVEYGYNGLEGRGTKAA